MSTPIAPSQPSEEADGAGWRSEISERLRAHDARRRHAFPTSLAFDFGKDAEHEEQRNSRAELKKIRQARRSAMKTLNAQEGCATPESCQPDEERETELRDSFSTQASEQGWIAENSAEKGAEGPLDAGSSFSNLIEFPRELVVRLARRTEIRPMGRVEELAEPVAAQLRIFEVDDVALPLPAACWADLRLDEGEDKSAKPSQKPDFELPLQVASLRKRLSCAAADCALVLLGFLVFLGLALFTAHGLPHSRSASGFLAGTPILLWGLYHWIFFTFDHATPGMQFAELGICTFDDDHAGRRQRQARALAGLISLASLGMGFLWVFADEDRIGWHDRMTRTYLREL